MNVISVTILFVLVRLINFYNYFLKFRKNKTIIDYSYYTK